MHAFCAFLYLGIGVVGSCLLAGDMVLGLTELTLAGLPLPDPSRLRLVVVPEEDCGGCCCWKLGEPPPLVVWLRCGWCCWWLWGPPGEPGKFVGDEGTTTGRRGPGDGT